MLLLWCMWWRSQDAMGRRKRVPISKAKIFSWIERVIELRLRRVGRWRAHAYPYS